MPGSLAAAAKALASSEEPAAGAAVAVGPAETLTEVLEQPLSRALTSSAVVRIEYAETCAADAGGERVEILGMRQATDAVRVDARDELGRGFERSRTQRMDGHGH